MSTLKNDSLLRAARGEPVSRTPVWIMRQAGRYLPEFRETRKNSDFFSICRTPELASEVTLQPIRRFDLDAAIIFSDILIIPQALGMEVQMVPEVGPVFPNPLQLDDVSNLRKSAEDINSSLLYLFDAVKLTKVKLDGKVPLIGFAGAPWTLMSYMIEGKGTKTASKAKKWLYSFPEQARILLEILTDAVIVCLKGQAGAGADFLQVFESHAEYLDENLFRKFCLPYANKIREALAKEYPSVPMCFFPKGGHFALQMLAENSSYDVISVDWTVDRALVRKLLLENPKSKVKAIQGNLDPCALYSNIGELKLEVGRMMQEFGGGQKGYIANLGHGIYPDMEPEKVESFVQFVHCYPN